MIHRPLVQIATETVAAIFVEGRMADHALERVFRNNRRLGARDRRFVAEIVYDVTRWWRRLNWILGRPELGQNAGVHPEVNFSMVQDAVRLRVVLQAQNSLPDWLEVPLAQQKKWQEQWALFAPTPAIEHSLPDLLEALGQSEVQEDWSLAVKAMNRLAPVFLRTNTLKINREELRQTLAHEGVPTEVIATNDVGLKLLERKNVFVTKSFLAGHFEVQDGGSQQIAAFLQPEPGERVIDACAGAGGKTLHLAALMKNRGKIIALDVHERKLSELRIRAQRAGVDIVEARLIETRKVIKRLKQSADRLLLDVPCSGSGVWRRSPDSRWKLTPEEVVRLQNLQFEILNDYTQMVKPGGTVVYATCSLWPGENQKQVQKFLQQSQERFTLEQELFVSPAHTEFDGFYAARLKNRQ